jgi:hypothetical protein
MQGTRADTEQAAIMDTLVTLVTECPRINKFSKTNKQFTTDKVIMEHRKSKDKEVSTRFRILCTSTFRILIMHLCRVVTRRTPSRLSRTGTCLRSRGTAIVTLTGSTKVLFSRRAMANPGA